MENSTFKREKMKGISEECNIKVEFVNFDTF